ncbi:hypothetical protein HK102_004237 [Quaeritorhiza haematococci]|nr:hypothetical protein HK102_004237 [Quaeritorhiza haematococci]
MYHHALSQPPSRFRKLLSAKYVLVFAVALFAFAIVDGQSRPVGRPVVNFADRLDALRNAPFNPRSDEEMFRNVRLNPNGGIEYIPKPEPTEPPTLPSILIVGGGPAGLWTGIKFLDAGYKDVTIIEKSPEFTRDDMVASGNSLAADMLKQRGIGGCFDIPASLKRNINCWENDEQYDQDAGKWVHFRHTFNLRDIQEGLLRAYRGKGGNFVIKEFKAVLESGEVASKDVVVCADGLHSECRQTLIGIQPQPAHIPGTDDGTLVPNAYGAKCILPAEFIPEHLSAKKIRRPAFAQYPQPQHRFRGYFARDGRLQISIQLTKQEFDGMDQSQPLIGSELLEQQLTAALQHYSMDELVPVALEHCQMTTFDIPLRHQPKDGFAKEHISPETGRKQLRVVVGDAAASAHYFTDDYLSGGVDIGFHLADMTVLSFNDYGGKKMKYAAVADKINERGFEAVSYYMDDSVKVMNFQ